jgi:hypothetical protein
MAGTSNDQRDQEEIKTIERAILHAVKGIRFGSVEIIIHDSKVVQIERKEKLRFECDSSRSSPMRPA